jgi:alkanesulfonate monooxygenase SsuD/methylene tetrahydromethanopterin reductase-like flavin-dependent oxidoreductase (luciferase family)
VLDATSRAGRPTNTIRLGSLVTPVGVRNRYLLKQTIDTVHQLAPERLDVGLGAGWNAAEYIEHSLPFPPAAQRLAELRETVDLLRSDQAGPPVWVGGKRPRLLAVAATANGWNTAWDCSPADYRDRVANLEAVCHAVGRDPGSVRRSLGLVTLVGRDAEDLDDRWRRLQRWAPGGVLHGQELRRWAASRLVGNPTQIRQQVRHWADLGVEQIICAPGAPFAVFEDEQLDLIAETLIDRT